ncbi:translesion error-prone DNA polymerase V autoproteolytic subunit [Aestuariicella sp. G3-2]|uniref:LexA family protein n=1 Tax=Pseudomaricurvus albidus TaxID=2842452 RepID=UPI001C0DE6AF|nr:translesion error-prone DNA polymerase V autoproteolytic subunit [Aestuariicella albida]MBU3070776.1 translesion error-prone DNA polymerase V autoproteolytic subunit [Aestuariicella albida]
MKLILYSHAVQAGFPSPADDYKEGALSLDDHLIEHPAATYLARAAGDSMEGVGIFDRDLLVIDRALEPVQGDVIVVALDGELTCKILDKKHQRLLAANPDFRPIPILNEQSLVIEGVVKASIRYHRKQPC